MIVERRLTAHIDWPLISAVIALSVVGLATIYSVTYDYRNLQPGAQFWVTLDTTERRDMKPSSPRKLFSVGLQDDILLFEQKFDVEKKGAAPRPVLPRALN